MFTSSGKVAWGQALCSHFVAFLVVWVAVLVMLCLGPALKHTVTFFFCAVMVSSWYGGLWPGLLTTFLSWLALDYYFIPPLYSLGISPAELPDMLAYSATALFIGWLNSDLRREKRLLQQAHDELDATVRERTADLDRTNMELQSEIADRRAAEEGLLQAQNEVARIARITTMGELAASIAHEPPVTVDRVQLQQVILNLVMNAIESMLEVGLSSRVLWIRTEKRLLGDLLIQVADSGVEIDPKLSSRIFEPFYTTKANGIGMGLSISRSIIETHGGRLWLSNAECGSTFCVTLPTDREARRG